MVIQAAKIKARVVNGINVDDLLDLIDGVKQDDDDSQRPFRLPRDRALALRFFGEDDVMKETIDARDESKDNCPNQEFTEERFLEQFAALEESLALLQAHMHSMSENAKLFGSLARHIRRSTCPTTAPTQDPCRCGLGQRSS